MGWVSRAAYSSSSSSSSLSSRKALRRRRWLRRRPVPMAYPLLYLLSLYPSPFFLPSRYYVLGQRSPRRALDRDDVDLGEEYCIILVFLSLSLFSLPRDFPSAVAFSLAPSLSLFRRRVVPYSPQLRLLRRHVCTRIVSVSYNARAYDSRLLRNTTITPCWPAAAIMYIYGRHFDSRMHALSLTLSLSLSLISQNSTEFVRSLAVCLSRSHPWQRHCPREKKSDEDG